MGFGTDADDVDRLALSMDCSRVFPVTTKSETQGPPHHLSVRDTRTGRILAESRIEFDVESIGFFPDRHRVWLIEKQRDVDEDIESDSYGKWVWEIARGEDSAETKWMNGQWGVLGCRLVNTILGMGDGGSTDSERKLHLLWLPPGWRAEV